MTQAIITNTIPSIKRELGSKLPDIFNAKVNGLVAEIGSQFEGVIKKKQESIEARFT